MSDKPTILPTGDSAELHRLVAEQMQRHNMRLRPGQTIETTVAEMQREGLALSVDHGMLVGKVGDQIANVPGCFETFYTKHDAAFYRRDVSYGIRSREQLADRKSRSDYIKKFSLAAYEALPRTEAEAGPTELNPATITRAEYVRLPLKTKSECIAAWGSATVAQIMARKK